ncbi:hypothetical protein TanjilG_19818 [Lupinus angustifolius]|uniref:Uncharacterized protein n=1 Tax=Lupinus angustifolius TaxID=3871 RepID=A0A1J7HXD2_LUPAN|nr:hypothetical protein TanjilG_19818 [Lupinus angustifolius]
MNRNCMKSEGTSTNMSCISGSISTSHMSKRSKRTLHRHHFFGRENLGGNKDEINLVALCDHDSLGNHTNEPTL